MVLEYYLTGGWLRIGKKEATLELLRKDSVLRPLLGYSASELSALVSQAAGINIQEDYVTLDFGSAAERKLSDDPTKMLNELKQRYGDSVGGKLFFKGVYTTFIQIMYFEADLETAGGIKLHITSDTNA
ncbi:hypothetical protein [Acetanaerobacterium elongatum]|uniref:Uncharacterized protein n=1 Tax=Acetanaerobacterium elongatum TaxID=258515 RepID=A0A1H0F1C8_9FIRM|nr:hypothetical protein [Acetanaerobacterium elongatum]SDN88346.1 hypothetical protein SAMN05192585_13720 [Acetanaerobacterium elongatum]